MSVLRSLVGCFGALLCVAVCAAQVPPPPDAPPDLTPLAVLQASPGESIAQAWRAHTVVDDAGAVIAEASTAEAEGLWPAGRPVLRLPCNFADTTMPRALWDRAVQLDLTTSTAVCFDVYARNLSAIGSINLYLRSGDGWYGARWFPRDEGRWCRVRIPLGQFSVDRPGGGWGDIRTIRFSPWVARREDAALYIANFGVERSPLAAALVVAEYRNGDGRLVDGGRWAENVSWLLDEVGCALPALRTADLTAERLADLKLLVMPYASGLPPESAGRIADFVRAGGKLIACFSLPRSLADLLGVDQVGWRAAARSGEFASMRFAAEPPSGAPVEVRQGSWGIAEGRAVEGVGEVVAWWHDVAGERTDAPAIILSDNGAWFSHVLLRDDPAAKGRLLVALAERLLPGSAQFVARRRMAALGRRLEAPDWEHAVASVRAQAGFDAACEELLARAQAQRGAAVAAADPFQAMSLADEAEQALVEAFCRAQVGAPDEFRATWCHPPEGIAGWGWERTAQRLREAGIDHLLLNVLHGASAAYPSAVLPLDRSNTEGRDYLAEAVEACAVHGIKVHVWMTNFRAADHTPEELMQRFRDEGRLAVRDDGTVIDTLCPSDPRNQQMQIDAMVEAAQRPGVAGIHFDYIRYPDGRTCFCDGCRRRFEAFARRAVDDWPADVQAGGDLREQWLEFRRANITHVVRTVAETVRREAPECMISAAVFQNYPACRDDVAQDWGAWAQAGYLDFVCPMNYTASHAQFRSLTSAQLAALDGAVPCYPGIGLLTGLGPVGAVRQVQIARELRTGGFVIWSVFPQYIDDVYPYLGMSLRGAAEN